MSRVRNADEFLLEFRRIRDDYERLFGPRLADIRRKYAHTPLEELPPSVDQSLEAHTRAYFVNALLAALNWRLNTRPEEGLPPLVPEAPVESQERGTTRFLDYLGVESGTHDPLLLVETKRRSSQLPKLAKPSDTPQGHGFLDTIRRGLRGAPLMGGWSGWLTDLKDYVSSVYERTGKIPRRVVLTNGHWLVLFLDPLDAFLEGGTCDPSHILFFSDPSAIENRYTELFGYLEQAAVLGETSALTPGELPFHVSARLIDRILFGLRIRYVEQPGIYQPSPVIKVAPAIFLRCRYRAWLRVENPPREYELPHNANLLSRHLVEVNEGALNLLAQVNDVLHASFHPSALCDHYNDEEGFGQVRGVMECGRDEFIIVTGDKTHYFLPEPSVSDCPFHDWLRSQAAGVASNPGPIICRSISPRSFFVPGEVHHCAHRDVAAAKASPITTGNRPRCAARSGQEGQAFCEIWRFESHLCCRTCAYETACTQAEVFRLPC